MGLRGLAGKTAIVTGAAGGIGAAVVTRLLEEGCQVVAVDLQAEALGQALGARDRLQLVGADVATEDGTAAYLQAAVARFGGVDLFVNNAGVFGERKPLVEMPVAAFDQVMAVNLRGVFLGLQAVLRRMIAQGRGGAIVNTSSVGALSSSPNCSVYNASKTGVISLTQVAANENGRHGVRINAVCPALPTRRCWRRRPAARPSSPPPFRSAGSAGRRRSPASWPSCSATRRASSPAGYSSPTAACC